MLTVFKTVGLTQGSPSALHSVQGITHADFPELLIWQVASHALGLGVGFVEGRLTWQRGQGKAPACRLCRRMQDLEGPPAVVPPALRQLLQSGSALHHEHALRVHVIERCACFFLAPASACLLKQQSTLKSSRYSHRAYALVVRMHEQACLLMESYGSLHCMLPFACMARPAEALTAMCATEGPLHVECRGIDDNLPSAQAALRRSDFCL